MYDHIHQVCQLCADITHFGGIEEKALPSGPQKVLLFAPGQPRQDR